MVYGIHLGYSNGGLWWTFIVHIDNTMNLQEFLNWETWLSVMKIEYFFLMRTHQLVEFIDAI